MSKGLNANFKPSYISKTVKGTLPYTYKYRVIFLFYYLRGRGSKDGRLKIGARVSCKQHFWLFTESRLKFFYFNVKLVNYS